MHLLELFPVGSVAGPLFPPNASFILMTGDGYIAGYFMATVLLPDLFDRRPEVLSVEVVRLTEAENQSRYRRGGILLALVLAVAWGVGSLTSPEHYPLLPADRDLFSAVPMLGLGACGAAIYAKAAASLSNPPGPLAPRVLSENKIGIKMEMLASCVFFTGYIMAWLRVF